ncbi:uncharacterized protein LOC141632680 [Silene latifolia]|uniref:uncharacterized protein LOC141632680 n=1 Tax=Silene latifolia TaxID=37657 RepID=UPI003D77DF0B
MWRKVDDFIPCIQQVWNQQGYGTKMYKVVMKLKHLKKPLKELNIKLFADIENSSVHAWKAPDFIQCHLVHDGDNNTNYFHIIMKGKYAKNQICRIAGTDGRMHEEGDQIQKAFLNYYEKLLGTSTSTTKVNSNVVQMSDEITSAILDFFTIGKLLQQVNHTFITLLPKCEMHQNVTQFRPIAYCNVLYKAISKILCTRLENILPHIISDTQGGFIKGRNIIENILIFQDLMRLNNRKTVSPRCLMKVDLKKAYD